MKLSDHVNMYNKHKLFLVGSENTRKGKIAVKTDKISMNDITINFYPGQF